MQISLENDANHRALRRCYSCGSYARPYDDVKGALYFRIRPLNVDEPLLMKFVEAGIPREEALEGEDRIAYLLRHVFVEVSTKFEFTCNKSAEIVVIESKPLS